MAQVIDPTSLSGETVRFGATVTIEDSGTGDEQTYTIVGEHEADIKHGLISIGSPMACALIGKSVGDEVVVKTPKGSRTIEIIDVKWLPVEWIDPKPLRLSQNLGLEPRGVIRSSKEPIVLEQRFVLRSHPWKTGRAVKYGELTTN